MTEILKAAGVPQSTLNYVPQVVDTRRTCRLWTRPGPKAVATVSIHPRFNEIVQCDLLLYNEHSILHVLDSAIRFHLGTVVPDKEGTTLLQALKTLCFQPFGAPREIVVDGETGLGTEEIGRALDRWGCTRRLKARVQHAQLVERRGEILRQQLHHTETQLRVEGLEITFECVLAEALLAGRVTLTISGSSPVPGLVLTTTKRPT